MFSSSDRATPFSPNQPTGVIGKYVLVGLTYLDERNNFVERQQVHGRIVAADEQRGYTIRLEGARKGEFLRLPPHPEPFLPAKPGEYQLKSTGEVVRDPDFLSTWIIQKPTPPPALAH
jgi:hypothetical protein